MHYATGRQICQVSGRGPYALLAGMERILLGDSGPVSQWSWRNKTTDAGTSGKREQVGHWNKTGT